MTTFASDPGASECPGSVSWTKQTQGLHSGARGGNAKETALRKSKPSCFITAGSHELFPVHSVSQDESKETCSSSKCLELPPFPCFRARTVLPHLLMGNYSAACQRADPLFLQAPRISAMMLKQAALYQLCRHSNLMMRPGLPEPS